MTRGFTVRPGLPPATASAVPARSLGASIPAASARAQGKRCRVDASAFRA